MISAYILIQTKVGKIAAVTASAQSVPGVSETASVVGPYDVVARAQAHDMDELAKLVTSKIQLLEGVTRTVSCAIVRL